MSSSLGDHTESSRLSRLSRPVLGLLLTGLLVGIALRFSGFSRGSDGVEFHLFHPDERTLIEAALSLESPADPPLTAYGLLPIYLAVPPLKLASLTVGAPLDVSDSRHRRNAALSLRAVAILVSLATLYAVWVTGMRHFEPSVASLAVFLAAVSPLAIQQAHFFTVDGLYALLAVITVSLALRTMAAGTPAVYAMAGVAVGLTAAVRLNGLTLGLVLLVAHLLRCRRESDRSFAGAYKDALLAREIWVAAIAAIGTLLVLEPYLILSPELLWKAESTDDLAYSARIASGDILKPWTLYYSGTTPYLYYWTHLWPLAVGWPLTAAFAMAVLFALWRRRERHIVLLVFIALDFLPTGSLYTKHVRYLLPSLPVLCLLAGDLCRFALTARRGHYRRAYLVGAASVCLATAFYGVAFARIYRVTDSRIQSGAWIAENLPAGSSIGVEGGGFSVSGTIDDSRFEKVALSTGRIFSTRGYMTCATASAVLAEPLEAADFIAITDANRYLQYTAVPELFPATSHFYDDLLSGKLGFEVLTRS